MSKSQKDINYQHLVSQADEMIKQGQISQVMALVKSLNIAQVPRESRQPLAKICRRIDLVQRGLRLLQPVIRHEQKNRLPPTPAEICEYSVLLSRNGSRLEAMSLLENVNRSQAPEASLYLAYCHISNWDYDKAVGPLKEFLKSGPDGYTQLVAQVNLISAHLALNQLQEAQDLLSQTIPIAENLKAIRLVGNCLELRARFHLLKKDHSRAREDLNRSLQIFSQSQSYDRLFIEKWLSVMEAFETESVDPLLRFRENALEKKEWESVREIDLLKLQIQFDRRQFDHLFFGTPMPFFRRRIQSETGESPSQTYVFGDPSKPSLDLSTGVTESVDFSAGKKIHQVIASLVKDFYVPRSLGTLFTDLYPNEFFDVNSSPKRVKQILFRTRQWLLDNSLPATIVQKDGSYELMVQGPFGIVIPLETPAIESAHLQWQQLKSKFPAGTEFSAKQACEVLHWPRSSFLLVVDWALKAGKLQRSGQGRSTLYKMALSSPNETAA